MPKTNKVKVKQLTDEHRVIRVYPANSLNLFYFPPDSAIWRVQRLATELSVALEIRFF